MDDLEFVRMCVKGDKQFWDQFLNKYSRLIYNYIYSVLSAKSYSFTQEHIRDIFQGIFYSLIKDNFKKLKSFKARNGCSLASWLRQVTVNFTIDFLRKSKPLVSIDEEISEDFSLKDILADNSGSADEALSYDEKLSALADCIKKLNNAEKYIIEVNIYRGLSLDRLKTHFGVSRGAIDMRKAKIIEKLRDCFKGKGFALDI